MEEEESFIPKKISRKGVFFYLPTHWFSLIEIFVVIGYLVLIFNPLNCLGTLDITEFQAVSLLHVFVFFFLLIFDRYITYYHQLARNHGYLSLFWRTNNLIHIPLYVWSAVNALLVILFSVMSTDEDYHGFNRLLLLRIMGGAEALIILFVLIYYIAIIWKHNASREVPDVQIELAHGFGFLGKKEQYEIESEEYKQELVSKQAEMIRYLQQQKANLSKEILDLNQKIAGLVNAPPIKKTTSGQFKGKSPLEQDNLVLRSENQQLKHQVDTLSEQLEQSKLLLEVEKESNAEGQALISKLNHELSILRDKYQSISNH